MVRRAPQSWRGGWRGCGGDLPEALWRGRLEYGSNGGSQRSESKVVVQRLCFVIVLPQCEMRRELRSKRGHRGLRLMDGVERGSGGEGWGSWNVVRREGGRWSVVMHGTGWRLVRLGVGGM